MHRSDRSGRTHDGFTLIELLVVVMVVAVLIALLLPAVQASREAARRAQCANNLKQIALGMLSYESSVGRLPIGVVQNNPSDEGAHCAGAGSPRCWGALAFVLGFIEQADVYNSLNFSYPAGGGFGPFPYAGAVNSTGMAAAIATYVCPGDSGWRPSASDSPDRYSQTSYFPSGGTWNTLGYYQGPECWRFDPGNGAFDCSTAYPLSSFTDGTSQTILLGESTRFVNDPDAAFNQWSRCYPFTSALDSPMGSTLRPQGLAYEVPRINAPIRPGDGDYGGVGLPAATNYPDTSDYRAWLLNLPKYKEFGQWGFRSRHPGCAQFAFADGSVRPIKESISLPTYQALGTRGSGEVVGGVESN